MVRIDGTSFGSITVDGKHYPHDVWILADGSIRRRNRNHEFTLNEFDFLRKGKPELVIVGTGQSGCVQIDKEAAESAVKKGVKIIDEITPDALKRYNEEANAGRRVAGAFHVTC